MAVRPGFKQTEVGVVPEDWQVRPLGDIAQLKNGYAFKSSTYTPIGNFNVVTIANVQDGFMDVAACNKIDLLPRDMQPHHRLELGDILISMTGNVGRVCRVTASNCLLNQRVGKLVPLNIDASLLFVILGSRRFLTAMAGKAKGGAQGNLNVSDITNFLFPLPPTKAEQEAIAEALSDADALIESLEQLLAKKRHIKQGAMQELLTGRTRLPGFETIRGSTKTEMGLLPLDWGVSAINDLVIKVGSGITPRGGNSNYREYGRPFVRSQNVGWGSLLLDDLVYIDEETHKRFPATELRTDDVLLNITGASIGRCAIADKRLATGNVNQHVCIIRTDSGRVAARFINYVLLSSVGQKQIDSFQAGGNREGLNFTQVRSIKIPLPSTKDEQDAIAAVLSDMDAEIAALETKFTKARALKQGMMQELLTGRIRLI